MKHQLAISVVLAWAAALCLRPGQALAATLVSIPAERARLVDITPASLTPLGEDVLANFRTYPVDGGGQSLTLEVSRPVLIEEPPFSDFKLRNNARFGATLAGQLNLALGRLSDDEQDERQGRILQMLSLAGLGIARDFISYDTHRVQVEPIKGEYDFSRVDFLVKQARRNHLQVVGRLSPHWGNIMQEGPIADANRQGYEDYVRACVKRYSGKIDVWQPLKEPEPRKRNRHGNDASLQPRDVVDILAMAHRLIKQKDPSAMVYFPGLGPEFDHERWTVDSYMEEILRLGGARYFDILGVDAYVYDLEQTMRRHRQLLDQYSGQRKPIWVAQVGVPAERVTAPINFQGGGSDQAQCEFMARVYVKAFGLGAQKVFWGEFLDNSKLAGAKPEPFDSTGLFFTETWQARPAFFTHRLLATALDGFDQVERLGPTAFRFRFPDRGAVTVAWPERNAQGADVQASRQVDRPAAEPPSRQYNPGLRRSLRDSALEGGRRSSPGR